MTDNVAIAIIIKAVAAPKTALKPLPKEVN